MPDRTYPGTDKYNQGPESLAEVVPVPECYSLIRQKMAAAGIIFPVFCRWKSRTGSIFHSQR